MKGMEESLEQLVKPGREEKGRWGGEGRAQDRRVREG